MPIWVVEICVKQTGLGTAWQFFLRVENIVEDKASLFFGFEFATDFGISTECVVAGFPSNEVMDPGLRPSIS